MLIDYLLFCMMFISLSAAPDPELNRQIDADTDEELDPCKSIRSFSDLEELATATCPDPEFVRKHVCPDCNSKELALKYTKLCRATDKIKINTVFHGDAIDALKPYKYIDRTYAWDKNAPSCLIDKPVMTWECTRKGAGNIYTADEWDKCVLKTGSTAWDKKCSAHHKKDGGHLYFERIICWSGSCPNPDFEKYHVCKTCTDEKTAKAFVERVYGTKVDISLYPTVTVFDGYSNSITYDEEVWKAQTVCTIDPLRPVTAWICTTNADGSWNKCTPQPDGKCFARSAMGDGHLYDETLECKT